MPKDIKNDSISTSKVEQIAREAAKRELRNRGLSLLGTLDHLTDLINTGTNTHADIDAHIADTTIHMAHSGGALHGVVVEDPIGTSVTYPSLGWRQANQSLFITDTSEMDVYTSYTTAFGPVEDIRGLQIVTTSDFFGVGTGIRIVNANTADTNDKEGGIFITNDTGGTTLGLYVWGPDSADAATAQLKSSSSLAIVVDEAISLTSTAGSVSMYLDGASNGIAFAGTYTTFLDSLGNQLASYSDVGTYIACSTDVDLVIGSTMETTTGSSQILIQGHGAFSGGNVSGGTVGIYGGQFSGTGNSRVRLGYTDSGGTPTTRFEVNKTGIGFFAQTPIARPSAYTITAAPAVSRALNCDANAGAYTGIDNAQAGTVYAQLTSLNDLRADVASLAAVVRQLIRDLGDTAGYGLLNDTGY